MRFLGAGGASGVRASKQRASIFLPPPPGRRRLALRNNKQQTCDQTHLVHSTTPRETNTVSFLCSYQQKKAYSRSRKLDFIPEDPASAKHHQPATALHRKTLSPPHITTLSNHTTQSRQLSLVPLRGHAAADLEPHTSTSTLVTTTPRRTLPLHSFRRRLVLCSCTILNPHTFSTTIIAQHGCQPGSCRHPLAWYVSPCLLLA